MDANDPKKWRIRHDIQIEPVAEPEFLSKGFLLFLFVLVVLGLLFSK